MKRQALIDAIKFNGVLAYLPRDANRWSKAYALEPEDDTGFVLECGYVGMPQDYREEHTAIDDLLRSMEDFAPLDTWLDEFED